MTKGGWNLTPGAPRGSPKRTAAGSSRELPETLSRCLLGLTELLVTIRTSWSIRATPVRQRKAEVLTR